ncbi:unnamed protein product [Rotaria magnacalcarata]|uniref:CTCK domain-containing protein n=3 Tax=Rotaria magnacalcarata TaxID=392030 RepID=A0A816Z0I4_9BILA|nr:unnamed protein product [Rotaria magnacalcarata]
MDMVGVLIQNVSVLNPSESRITSINAQTDFDSGPIHSVNTNTPAVVYNPYVADVTELDITIPNTQDNSVPSKLHLAIYGCTNASIIGTTPQTERTPTQALHTTQPSTRSGKTTELITETHENSMTFTIVVFRKHTTPQTAENISSLILSKFPGSTRIRCEEMQVVDEAVSKNIIVTPNPLPIGENIKFQPTSQQGVSFGGNDRTPTITVNFGKPAEVHSVTLPRNQTPNGNVQQFEVTFYSPDGNKINDKPILNITIVSTTDGESPKGVVLDIIACTEATTETTNVTPVSTAFTSSSTGTGTGTGTSTGAGTVTVTVTTESAETPETSAGHTPVTSIEGSTLIGSTGSGSTTEAVSGTTTKTCQEMQAVDEAVSKNIIVTPNPLPIGENIKFQPISRQGVSFGGNDRTPTITVSFGKPAEVHSVTLPRDHTPNGNVQQFEVTFYSPDGNKINGKPFVSNASPNEDKTKPAELDSSQIPSNTPVSRVDITIVSTTDGESPKGVVLDIIACAEVTTEPSTTHSSSTYSADKATDEVTNETTTVANAALRCQTENMLVEELGIVDAEAIIETAKGETKVIGYIIRSNNTGWTPPSTFSSLIIGFRYPVQIGRILVTANNLKQWRLYYQSASEVFPYWIAYNNSMVLTNSEIIFSRTLNATKIRLTPNSGVENLRLEVFACGPFLNETATTNRPCVLTEWSDWGACSRTCGVGYQIRTRKTNSSDICGDEQLIEYQSCMDHRCQCSIDEAFYKRVFQKESSDNTEIGYIFTYSNSTNASKNIIYVNDTIDQGTVVRTKDHCYIVYCTTEGLKLSDNQCVTTTTMSSTTVVTNNTRCTMQQFSNTPIKANNGRCISRQSVPREHCGGYCESDSDYECKCCSIGTTYLQPVLFDCLVNGSKTVTEEKMIDIRRIQTCSCNVCHDDCAIRQYESSPLRINSNRCVSREKVPRERCSGHCESDSDDQCTCCSITKTYLQPIIFDCLVNEAQNVTEQRTMEIRRIKACSCNICSSRSLNNEK